jgi:TrbB protein
MKRQDIVRVVSDLLYLNFDATGSTQSASVFNLSKGITIGVDDTALVARSHEHPGETILVESFATDSLARNAMENVQAVMTERARHRHVVSWARNVAKYAGIPLVAIVLIATISASRRADRQAASNSPTAGYMAGPVAPYLSGAPAPAPNDMERLAVSADKILPALQQGAASDHYAVKMGVAKGDAIYVFEDPQCPHCQTFTPELEKLSKKHPVYIFPVSAIGGVSSAKLNAVTLCAPAAKRAQAWEMALTGALQINAPGSIAPTSECQQAQEANDAIYQTIGLRGTPTLFDSKGHKMPYSTQLNAEAVGSWLDAGA